MHSHRPQRACLLRRIAASFAAVGALCAAAPALANPADYIYMPQVEYGEREVDLKYGNSSTAPNNPDAEGSSIGLGYGAGEHWFTEIYLKRERVGNKKANLAEWENKFQLTEAGEYFVDVGYIVELEAPLSANAGWEVNTGPLFQKDFGMVQANLNFLFQHAYRQPDDYATADVTNLGYQWQVKYRWSRALEYGFQGIGGMGQWNNWSRQSNEAHMAGPAVMGRVLLGGRNVIQYNTAWLFGVSRNAPRNTFRLQVEYEF